MRLDITTDPAYPLCMIPFPTFNIHAISGWFEANSELAGITIALITGAESMPVIGLFVPGTAFMVVVLSLLAVGVVDFWTLFAWMTAGAIFGDAVGYHLGRYYQDPMNALMRRHIPEKSLKRAEDLTAKYGVWAIGISRFIPVLRAFVPTMAGIGHLPVAQFYIANVISAVIWVAVHLMAGEILNTFLLFFRS